MVRMTPTLYVKLRRRRGGRGEGGPWPRDTLDILRARHAARLLVGHAGRPAAERHRGASRSCCSSAPRAAVQPRRAPSRPSTALATAVGQPLLGRLVDLYGQPRVHAARRARLRRSAWRVFAFAGTDPLPLAYARRGRRRAVHAAAGGRAAGAVARACCGAGGPGAHGVRAWTRWRRRSCSPSGRCWSPWRRRCGRRRPPLLVAQRRRGAGRALRGRRRRPRARGARRRARRTGWARCARPGCWRCSARSSSSASRSARSRWPPSPYADDHGGDVGVRLADGGARRSARWSAASVVRRAAVGRARPSGGCGCWWRCWRSATCR